MVNECQHSNPNTPINVYEGERPVCQCQTAEDARRIVAAMNAAPALLAVSRRLLALDPPSPYNGSAHVDPARTEWFAIFEAMQNAVRTATYGKGRIA